MRARGAPTAAGVAVVLLVALVACTPSRAEPPPSSDPTATTSTSAPTPEPQATTDPTDPAVVRAAGAPLTSGAVTLSVAAAGVTTAAQDDGSARADVPDGAVLVAAPDGMTLDGLSDGSVVVRDGSARFVAGLTTEPWHAVLEQVGPAVVRLTADEPLHLWLAAAAVQSAVWGEAEGGRSLAVVPTAWGRARSLAAQDGLWTQVVEHAPDADTPGMRDQLECHELGAPDKESWNLEPWRPVVDGVDMIAARCNPT